MNNHKKSPRKEFTGKSKGPKKESKEVTKKPSISKNPRLEIASGGKLNILFEGKTILMATIKHESKEVWLVKKHDPTFFDTVVNYTNSLGYKLERY